jgi:hypothetical protein
VPALFAQMLATRMYPVQGGSAMKLACAVIPAALPVPEPHPVPAEKALAAEDWVVTIPALDAINAANPIVSRETLLFIASFLTCNSRLLLHMLKESGLWLCVTVITRSDFCCYRQSPELNLIQIVLGI